MVSRVYIFVPQLADDPPLNPVRKAFNNDSEAIEQAKSLLVGICDRVGLKGGSVAVGEQPDQDSIQWLGTWRWTPHSLWSWEGENAP
jgi:hypothetical protein